jgi:hypothetical protein
MFLARLKFNFPIYSLHQVSIKHFSNINKYKKNTKVLILDLFMFEKCLIPGIENKYEN